MNLINLKLIDLPFVRKVICIKIVDFSFDLCDICALAITQNLVMNETNWMQHQFRWS